MTQPQSQDSAADEPNDHDVDEVFAALDDNFVDRAASTEPESTREFSDSEFYGEVESRPLQFQLRALFAALLLTGLFSMAYLYQRLFGFLLFFAVATAMGARARGKRERMVATMFFGGAALLCGGLMMAESSRPPIAIMGLILACLGGYASLHGLALVVSSFWE